MRVSCPIHRNVRITRVNDLIRVVSFDAAVHTTANNVNLTSINFSSLLIEETSKPFWCPDTLKI